MGSPTVKHRSFHAEAFEGPVQLDGAAVAGTVAAGHRRLPGELGGGRTAANGLEHRLGATGQDVVAGLHGAIPIPPPTSNGLSTPSRNPFPSGPRIASVSPGSSPQRARVPGPIGSIRNASSFAAARHSDIGRGSNRRGASSMKNCPGMPCSSPPRSTRSNVYGPTRSFATTLRRSRLSKFSPLGTRSTGRRSRAVPGGSLSASGLVDHAKEGDNGGTMGSPVFSSRLMLDPLLE